MLHNGYDPVIGKKIGIESGEVSSFTSIDDVMRAYEKQLDFFMEKFVTLANRTLAGHAFTPVSYTHLDVYKRQADDRTRHCARRKYCRYLKV